MNGNEMCWDAASFILLTHFASPQPVTTNKIQSWNLSGIRKAKWNRWSTDWVRIKIDNLKHIYENKIYSQDPVTGRRQDPSCGNCDLALSSGHLADQVQNDIHCHGLDAMIGPGGSKYETRAIKICYMQLHIALHDVQFGARCVFVLLSKPTIVSCK